MLIEHFLEKFNNENNKKVHLSNEVIQLLIHYDWPGNVRELENCIERLVVLAEDESVTFKTIPPAIQTYFNDIKTVTPPIASDKRGSFTEKMQGMEQDALKKALERSGWVQAKAARLLGMTPRQVAYKIKKYKLFPGKPILEDNFVVNAT
ncbi:MAG: hypothetical protein MPW15_08605 [Candidatus Manganitrophus sp.]|nr:hypothetical protein [Candidatus Manganitrophus sp.]